MNRPASLWLTGVISSCFIGFGCSSEPAPSGAGGTGGAPTGGTSASPGGVAGTIQGGASAGGTAAGTGGSVGGTSVVPGAGGNSGGVGGSTGGTGTGGAGGTGGGAGGSGGLGGGGPVVSASCADHDYDLCLDFENGIDTTKWTGGTPGAIITTDFAHGGHAYRLYPNPGGLLKATNLGAIKDVIWGRFYVHFAPGAPGGHGNIVGAFDQSNNWYEMGWQFDAMMGVWHATGGNERPLRSKPFIVDQWYCIELQFDGTKTEMPKWWIDGQEAEYYMAANEQLIPKVVTQFARIEVGFTPYAGLGLQMPDGKGPKDDRVLTDMAIDDIAFDTERIGCLAPVAP